MPRAACWTKEREGRRLHREAAAFSFGASCLEPASLPGKNQLFGVGGDLPEGCLERIAVRGEIVVPDAAVIVGGTDPHDGLRIVIIQHVSDCENPDNFD